MTTDLVDLAKFQQSIKEFQFGVVFDVPAVFIAGIHNARIFGRDCIVSSAKGDIFIDSSLSRQDVLESSGIYHKLRRGHEQRLDGQYCLLTTPWSWFQYYHWVMDALPRLALLDAVGDLQSVPVIVPGNPARYHGETLALAGISPERLIPAVGNLVVDQLIYLEPLSISCNPSPRAVSWLRQRFLKHACRTPKRRIYVSRRDAKRTVINEEEIVCFLESRGFTVVCPGDHSFEEQVSIFSTASVVIGPHGAGLTNMVFAPEGATLIEFFGDNYINGCFWALANVCGQRHAAIIAPTDTLNYSISLDSIKAMLDKLGL